MARLLLLEQPLGVLRKFENLHALVHIGLLGGLVSIDRALQAALFLAPFAGHLVVEVAADLSVELIDVHGADAIAEASVLGPEPLDRRLVLPALVSMAGVERLANPG